MLFSQLCQAACCPACREEIAWTLQTLSVNALELARMWEHSGFSSLMLTDVQEQGFLEQLPMQVCLPGLLAPSCLASFSFPVVCSTLLL